MADGSDMGACVESSTLEEGIRRDNKERRYYEFNS